MLSVRAVHLRTMESSGLLSALLFITLFIFISSGQLSPDQSAEDGRNPDITAEKELIEAMEELLGRFQDNLPSTEKRAIPKCLVGSRCAMRLGPRWGPLCECSRGTYCNSILLKCI